MKTWTLIWITSYSKMMVRDIFHFRKVQASAMGLILLWMSILKCIHLHFMIIFFIAAMRKCWFKSVKLILKLFGLSLTLSYTAMGLFICKYFLELDFYQKFPTFFEVKIYINRVNLTPCQAHWVLKNMPLGGGAKDEHFFFLSKVI